MQKNRLENGMVALFPALILSGIMLLIIGSSGSMFSSMLSRTTYYENKFQSNELAKSCARKAVSKISLEQNYIGGIIKIFDYDCDVEISQISLKKYYIESAVGVLKSESIDKVMYDSDLNAIYDESIF